MVQTYINKIVILLFIIIFIYNLNWVVFLDHTKPVSPGLNNETNSPDQSFIDSPFEDYDMSIPLLIMLKNLLGLDGVELLFILLLIIIIFNTYFYSYYIIFLKKINFKNTYKIFTKYNSK